MLKVLILDPNSSALADTDRCVKWTYAFWTRLGGVCQLIKATVPSTSSVFTQSWDIIVVPWVKNVAGNYTTLQTMLGYFSDTTIPVYVVASDPSLSSGITNVVALNAAADANYQSSGIKGGAWASRLSTRESFYSKPATLASMTGTYTIHADDGTNVFLWSNTVSGHPVLWQCGITSTAPGSTTSSMKFWKPWLAAQWMCDLDSAKIVKLRPMYFLLRYDGYDDFTQANFDTIYSAAQTYGLEEIWLAATWGGALGSVSPTKAAWLVARKEQSGGLFRVMNHLSDLVDGTTGGAGSKCTSDGVAFDLFGAANTVYRGHCDQLTAAGWQVGADGYGRGYPNVQHSNDMNNPAAKFLGEIVQAGAIWLFANGSTSAKLYPSAPAGATPGQYNANWSRNWNGAWTIYAFSLDSLDPSSAVNYARTFNSAFLENLVWGGGAYFHESGSTFFANGGCLEVFSKFTTCPDVIKSGPFEDMLTQQKLGPGMHVLA